MEDSEDSPNEERTDAVEFETEGTEVTVDNSSLTTVQLRIIEGNIFIS